MGFYKNTIVLVELTIFLQIILCCAKGIESSNSTSLQNGPAKSRTRRALSNFSFLKENIPGTHLQSGQFYTLRMKRFPSGVVSWSTRKHDSGYNYIFVDNVAAHQTKYAKDGPWHKDTQWAFLSSKEPGWYHLINRGIPCQYATWSDSETIDSVGTFYMVLDPNHPGHHSEDDFLFKPYQPHVEIEGIGKPYYQLKVKSMPNAVISWNAGNSTTDSYYIHMETTNDTIWLKRYTWGHVWYDDTLFSFEPVIDGEEERLIEEYEDENEENNELFTAQPQRQYASLVGEPSEYSSAGVQPNTFCTNYSWFAIMGFMTYLNFLIQT